MKIQWGMLVVTLLLTGTVNAKTFDTDIMMFETFHYKPERTSFMLSAGYTSGGEEFGEFEYQDGSSEQVESGSGLYVGLGAAHRFQHLPFSIKILAAYQLDSMEGDLNGTDVSIDFARIELDLVGQYHISDSIFIANDSLFLGAGLTQHSGVELTSNFASTIEFDTSIGYIFEVGYRINGMAVSARYTDISYENEFFEPIDSSNVGIFFDVYM